MVEGGNSSVSPVGEIWKRIDHTLVRLKVFLIEEEMRKLCQRDFERILDESFRDEDPLNPSPTSGRILNAQAHRTDEWAGRVYRAYCDVWAAQGYEKSPSFLQAVYERAIAPLIAARCSVAVAQASAEDARLGCKGFLIKFWEKLFRARMRRLARRWDAKLAIEARECEYARRLRKAAQPKEERVRYSPQAKKRPRRSTARDRVIFGAIQAGMKGPHYCAELDERKLPIPAAWIEEGCPSTYQEAYRRGQPWRKRIQNEKHKSQEKYDKLSPAQRESIIEGTTRPTRS
jgi:hypothetical protein